jgi:hypothetical protein
MIEVDDKAQRDMNAVFVDSQVDERRKLLYEGQLFVYSPTPSSLALSDFAQKLSGEALAPHDPKTAQFDLAPEKFASILEVLKPKFI